MANPAKAFASYLRESKQELEKVTWPTQKEVVNYSILTIVFSIVLAAYFGVLDFVLNEGFTALLQAYT